MDVISVVGARPQFVKLAPVADAFAGTSHRHRVVHTGQHYDHGLSDVFFEEFGLDRPDWHLGVGSGSHGAQTGAMLAAMDELFAAERPDWIIVYGDTNSTLAAAVAAVKLHLRVAHVEAGLRSFNRRMPEEHNRVLTDHASDLLLAPTRVAAAHLEREGLGARARVVGDVMADVVLKVAAAVGDLPPALDLPDGGSFVLSTIHRAENTDDPARLRDIIEALAASPVPVLLPVHPRLRDKSSEAGIELDTGAIRPIAPLGYRDLVATVRAAHSVATDSGGLQKEAVILGTPVTTIRPETEWVETLEGGWNVLCPDLAGIHDLMTRPTPAPLADRPYGDGRAAEQVVAAIEDASH